MVFAWLVAYWWVLLLEALALAGVVGALTLAAPRLIAREPSSLARLKASMALTALAVFLGGLGLIWGVARFVEWYTGAPGAGGGLALGVAVLVGLIMVAQWLFSPYIINLVYRVREPVTPEERALAAELARIARASGIKEPRLVIARMRAPNAFAYGSPLAGSYVAVTEGLLASMPREEVRAVLAHEVGHLKHRDVAWILALSLIPVAVYYMGRALIWASLEDLEEERGDEERNPLLLLAVGAALVAAGVLFKFLVAHFNRLREYYADAHSALTLGSPRPLQRALARIHLALTHDPRAAEEVHSATITQLFIVAPLVELSGGFLYDIDAIVEALKNEETSPVQELFSTHPPVPKRLRFLDNLAKARP